MTVQPQHPRKEHFLWFQCGAVAWRADSRPPAWEGEVLQAAAAPRAAEVREWEAGAHGEGYPRISVLAAAPSLRDETNLTASKM